MLEQIKLQKILMKIFNDFEKIYKILKEKKIDLVIVGPEEPLVNGIVDFLSKKI